MTTSADTAAASAAATEIQTPNSLEEAMETGFLPEDPHYRLTGEFKADKTEPSAGSKEKQDAEKLSGKEEASAASGVTKDADTAAASAAADTQEKRTQQKTSATSESRWAKLARENRELKAELARAKTAQPPTETTRDTKQASQPAAETGAAAPAKPKIDDVDPKTGKAKYANYGEYEAAKDEWLQSEAIRKFTETSTKTQREQELARAEQTLAEGFAKKLDVSRKAHTDFDTVALNPDLVIPKGSVTDGFLLDSAHAGELLYHLGQHPEILEGFYGNHDPKTGKYVNKVTPYAQARELTKLEIEIAGKASAGSSGTGSSGTSQSQSSSARPVTQAPRPPHQTSGKGSVAKDAVEQAVEEGDTESYIREQNARELARRKRN
jgi:hypothetical protein